LAAVRILGVALIVLGAIILLEAFARFVLEGLGTSAPVAPTEHLVVGGLYRYVRNPMYLAVGAIIVGQGLVLGQPVLFLSAAGFALAVAAFVHWYEERWRHDVRGCEASRQVRGCPRR
jgi:protein-S-isoprenylcysteine O-methyltransferase Ste14